MTSCKNKELRNLVLKTGDKELLEKYDEMVNDCIIGEWATKDVAQKRE